MNSGDVSLEIALLLGLVGADLAAEGRLLATLIALVAVQVRPLFVTPKTSRTRELGLSVWSVHHKIR